MITSSSSNGELVSVPDLVHKLCSHIAKNDQAATARLYKLAVTQIQSSVGLSTLSDEQFIISDMRTLLPIAERDCEEKFQLLYSLISRSSVLQHKCAILTFLTSMAKVRGQKENHKWNLGDDFKKFSSLSEVSGFRSKSRASVVSSGSQESFRQLYQGHLRPGSEVTTIQSTTVSNIPSSIWTSRDADSSTKISNLSIISEPELLQDVVYSLQGIEGKYLKKEAGGTGFSLDQKSGRNLTPVQKGVVDMLTAMGFLHNKLKQFCDENDKQRGAICQALITIIRDEMSEYYKTIALLQANLKQPGMSLRRVLFLLIDHQNRFEWLAYITEECNDKKGGALITSIHGFLQHGSTCAQAVAERVLTAVCKPLYIMLSRWLLDGEINDISSEFFIEARTINTSERLWHDKYNVRKSMVPSFITMEQAKKILATGKSINFLRQICKDGGQLPGRECLQKLFKSTTADALFAPELSIEFYATLENVYRETSLRVLDLLKDKFRLMEHFHSLRRYLLLGQGDFIRHLLELLAPELNKPANHIYSHTLTAILESAIRVTNAQFEDEDTLRRLNVSLMNHSHGDCGWDVFSLSYVVDGPISTIFKPYMATYQSLFGALWKAKRMEFVLANLRKQQITISKLFRNITELKSVIHTFHILTSEMIHFSHQTQYYFLFEVLECSWAEMLKKVNQAECLDDIIGAHNTFLTSVRSGVLLDEKSMSLFSQLRSIYNFVLSLESSQDSLYTVTLKEYEARNELNQKIEKGDGFGMNLEEEMKAKERLAVYQHFLLSMKTSIKRLAEQYTEFVTTYLKSLSSSSNMDLQLLSVRLSFNDYYKNK